MAVRKKAKHAKPKEKMKIKTLDMVLVIVFGIFLWFNYRMITMYAQMGSIPEGYACTVVAALIGECGVCGWIRTTKSKREEHEWEKEKEAEVKKQEESEQISEEGGKG